MSHHPSSIALYLYRVVVFWKHGQRTQLFVAKSILWLAIIQLKFDKCNQENCYLRGFSVKYNQWITQTEFITWAWKSSFLSIFKFYFNIFFFTWSTVDLPCCVNFCCTAKWLSCYTYIYSFLYSFLFWFITGYWI